MLNELLADVDVPRPIKGTHNPYHDIERPHAVLVLPKQLAHDAAHVVPRYCLAGNLAPHHDGQAGKSQGIGLD